MPNHALNQVMSQPKACLRPALAIAERPPGEEESERDPAKEQEHVQRPPAPVPRTTAAIMSSTPAMNARKPPLKARDSTACDSRTRPKNWPAP